MATPEQLVLELSIPEQRENALLDLSKRREAYPDLALLLWHSCGTITTLLQEVVAIYPMLSPPTLTAGASNRACNALAVLQCVASHPETRVLFLNAHIPLYLYPFLNTVSKTRPFEYLRLTSLGVIGALVKVDDTDVVNFLLSTEIIPLCLRTMEMGSELSKTVATFIVQKILLDDVGLAYICATAERFFAGSRVGSGHAFIVQKILLDDVGLAYICATAERFFAVSAVLCCECSAGKRGAATSRAPVNPSVAPHQLLSAALHIRPSLLLPSLSFPPFPSQVSAVLGKMVQLLAEHPSVRLLKHIIRCYLPHFISTSPFPCSPPPPPPPSPSPPGEPSEPACQISSETPPSQRACASHTSPYPSLPPCSPSFPSLSPQVSAVLGNMVQLLAEHPSVRLLKHIIRCYLRLSDNPRAGEALRTCLPDLLRDATFSACLRDDVTTRRWLAQLLINVGPPLHQGGGGGAGGVGGGPPGPPQALHGGGGNPVPGGPGGGGVGMHGGGGAGLHSSSPSPLHGTSSPMHAAQRLGQMGGPMGVVGGMGGGVGGMGLPSMDTLPPVN
ncbi:unnamed protein product [Closterium sp. NIES-53]